MSYSDVFYPTFLWYTRTNSQGDECQNVSIEMTGFNLVDERLGLEYIFLLFKGKTISVNLLEFETLEIWFCKGFSNTYSVIWLFLSYYNKQFIKQGRMVKTMKWLPYNKHWNSYVLASVKHIYRQINNKNISKWWQTKEVCRESQSTNKGIVVVFFFF